MSLLKIKIDILPHSIYLGKNKKNISTIKLLKIKQTWLSHKSMNEEYAKAISGMITNLSPASLPFVSQDASSYSDTFGLESCSGLVFWATLTLSFKPPLHLTDAGQVLAQLSLQRSRRQARNKPGHILSF